MMLQTTIVVPVLNALDYTRLFWQSLVRNTDPAEASVVFVDNGSTDGTREWLDQIIREGTIYGPDGPFQLGNSQPKIQAILNKTNRGFPGGCNDGIGVALESGADLVCLMNNDVLLTPGWLPGLRAHVEAGRPDVIGPVTNYAAGLQQHSINLYKSVEDLDREAAKYAEQRRGEFLPVSWLVFFCVLVRAEVFRALRESEAPAGKEPNPGELDEDFGIGNGEDIDFSIRAGRAGFRLGIARNVYLHHFGDQTFKANGMDLRLLVRAANARLKHKWGGEFIERLKQEIED